MPPTDTEDIYAKGRGQIDFKIFAPAILIIIALGLPLAINPTFGKTMVDTAHSMVTTNFGWLAMLVPAISIVFLLYMVFGPYAHVKLGGPDEEPEFTTLNWIAMIFCSGIGSSIIIWGVAEPIYYISNPPLGITPKSVEAYSLAHALPSFHWGIHGWCIYTVASLAVAYSVYVRRAHRLRLSTSCEPIFGKYSRSICGSALEILVVVGTVGGYGTSLAIGVPFIATFVSKLMGVPDDLKVKGFVLVVWTLIFAISAYRGLTKGMQILSRINVWLVVITLVFIFIAGPTLFILDMSVNSLGQIFTNFFSLTFSIEPLNFTVNEVTHEITRQGGFPQEWPVFYWLWFLALTPITALFIARISKGRTIREVTVGVVAWGSLGCFVIISILGGYSLYLQKTGTLELIKLLQDTNPGTTAATVLFSLPWVNIMVPIYILMSMIFLATTLDASSYTLASICTKELKGDEQPPRILRLTWALILGFFSIGLLITGEKDALKTIQTSAVALGLPLFLAWMALMVSLYVSLKQDFGQLKAVPPEALDREITNNYETLADRLIKEE